MLKDVTAGQYCIGHDYYRRRGRPIFENYRVRVYSFSVVTLTLISTNGYKFAPRGFDLAISICELESVLSLSERPEPMIRPAIAKDKSMYDHFSSNHLLR